MTKFVLIILLFLFICSWSTNCSFLDEVTDYFKIFPCKSSFLNISRNYSYCPLSNLFVYSMKRRSIYFCTFINCSDSILIMEIAFLDAWLYEVYYFNSIINFLSFEYYYYCIHQYYLFHSTFTLSILVHNFYYYYFHQYYIFQRIFTLFFLIPNIIIIISLLLSSIFSSNTLPHCPFLSLTFIIITFINMISSKALLNCLFFYLTFIIGWMQFSCLY